VDQHEQVNRRKDRCVTILEASVTTSGGDGMGVVTGGHIKLSGRLARRERMGGREGKVLWLLHHNHCLSLGVMLSSLAVYLR
jgi:hypothetical protein